MVMLLHDAVKLALLGKVTALQAVKANAVRSSEKRIELPTNGYCGWSV